MLKYWCGSPGRHQNIPMCSHRMLDRYKLVIIHFFSLQWGNRWRVRIVGLKLDGVVVSFATSACFILQMFDMSYLSTDTGNLFTVIFLERYSLKFQWFCRSILHNICESNGCNYQKPARTVWAVAAEGKKNVSNFDWNSLCDVSDFSVRSNFHNIWGCSDSKDIGGFGMCLQIIFWTVFVDKLKMSLVSLGDVFPGRSCENVLCRPSIRSALTQLQMNWKSCYCSVEKMLRVKEFYSTTMGMVCRNQQ